MPVYFERFVLAGLAALAVAQLTTNPFGLELIWRILLTVGLSLIALPIAFYAHARNERRTGTAGSIGLRQFGAYLWIVISWPESWVVILVLVSLVALHIVGQVGIRIPTYGDGAVVATGLLCLWAVVLSRRLRLLKRGWHMWPMLGMMAGGLLFIGCAVWLYADNALVNREIQNALKRYVLPRHLTETQIKAIGDYLLQHDPYQVRFVVLKQREEASALRADIQNALMRGGWKVTTIDYADDVPEGISANFIQTAEHSQTPSDPRHPKPDQLIREAFQQAHIQFNNFGGGSGIAIKEDSLTISIGTRRMDDGDLIGKKLMRERALKMLESADEE